MTRLVLFLGLLASLVLAAFIVLSVSTLGIAVFRQRDERHRADARSRVRAELFDRQRRDDLEWDGWLAGLSSAEREELESVLERYLRNVSGSERRLYRLLAQKLEMGKRADEQLDRDAVVPRLRALSLLSLLSYPIDRARLFETCLDSRRTRQAAASLVYERRDEFEHAGIVGALFLLWDNQRALTAHGLETLYDLNDGNPRPILLRGSRYADAWSPTLIDQVCTVLGYCQATGTESQFEWVFPLFEHEDPRVRAAAIKVFRQQGWQRQLRMRIPFRALVTDDDPRVRWSTYQVLSTWGDERARQLLEWAVIGEDHRRCQLMAVRALAALDATPETNSRGWPATSWDWVRAERTITDPSLLEQTAGPEAVS